MTQTVQRPRAEWRTFDLSRIEVRRSEPGTGIAGTIAGYAAVYGSISDDLGGWREMLRTGAFRDVLATNPDVRMPFLDHAGLPVGRTRAGTLRLREDDHGLAFENDTPDTERGRELILAVERGDVDQCSFRFVVLPEDRDWSFPEDDLPLRGVNRVDELWDVCLVTFPAYPATSAGVRSLDTEPPEPIPADPRALGALDLRRRQLRRERRAVA